MLPARQHGNRCCREPHNRGSRLGRGCLPQLPAAPRVRRIGRDPGSRPATMKLQKAATGWLRRGLRGEMMPPAPLTAIGTRRHSPASAARGRTASAQPSEARRGTSPAGNSGKILLQQSRRPRPLGPGPLAKAAAAQPRAAKGRPRSPLALQRAWRLSAASAMAAGLRQQRRRRRRRLVPARTAWPRPGLRGQPPSPRRLCRHHAAACFRVAAATLPDRLAADAVLCLAGPGRGAGAGDGPSKQISVFRESSLANTSSRRLAVSTRPVVK